MAEDRLLELPQLGSRLETQLVEEDFPRLAIGLERLGLATGSVEREHEEAAESLARRMLRDQGLELADRLFVPADPDLGLDPILGRSEPQLLEARDLGLRKLLVPDVDERRPPPEGERLSEELGSLAVGLLLERGRPLGGEPLESLRVELVRLDVKTVSEPVSHDPVLAELAQLGDVHLERVRRRRGWLLAPEVVDQALGGNRLVPVQEQEREQGPGLPAFCREGCSIERNLERAENPVLHSVPPHRIVTRRLQPFFRAGWEHRSGYDGGGGRNEN